ncbi:recombinase family protein [Eubacteriales bacterium OttesenSCG-928-N13]|nr:recombinase family protein [Eubacteriales bacterium OttesenSCG-928-N13]
MLRKPRIAKQAEPPRALRAAGYGRVSSGKDAMLESLSAQVSYYSTLIQNHPGWVFAGVYADEALTGTKDNRPEFQRMLADCRAGKIDMILVKAISRLARNTVTLLATVRELKALGVDVFFERENIHTMSAEGELILTLIAAVAQEESRSVSENCKWRVRSDFAKGLPNGIKVLGYRFIGGEFTIIPEEAEVVKMIFDDYLSGMGRTVIANKLHSMNAITRFGGEWSVSTVFYILRNIMYAGDLLLQKSYVADHITKELRPNRGELPSVMITNNHEPIIDRAMFDAVQQEIARRAQAFAGRSGRMVYPFSGLLVCGCCGKHYRRKHNGAGTKYERIVWICDTYNMRGKSACPSKQVPEDILERSCMEALQTAAVTREQVANEILSILVPEPHRLVFFMKDGRELRYTWEDRPRSAAWDDAARERARQQTKARYAQ